MVRRWTSAATRARYYRFVVLDLLLVAYAYSFARTYGDIDTVYQDAHAVD